MKQSILVSFAVVVLAGIFSQNIYSFSVPTIEGQTQSLSSFNGKRVMVITLPVERSGGSDSMLTTIDSLASTHSSNVQIIGVPAIEDGFMGAHRDSLRTWYRSFLDSSIVISDGLTTRKTSGSLQHPLFTWLTTESENGHFNLDVSAPGFKFFTNAEGQLVAVLKPQTKLSSISVTRALQAQ